MVKIRLILNGRGRVELGDDLEFELMLLVFRLLTLAQLHDWADHLPALPLLLVDWQTDVDPQ